MTKNIFTALFFLAFALTFSQTQIGNTLEGDVKDETFGRQVILNQDGTQLLVTSGTYKDPVLGANTGRAQVFTLNENQWQRKGNQMTGLTAVSGFGIEGDMTPDGAFVAIGAPFYPNNTAEPRRGEVRIFKFENNDWVQFGQQILGVRAGDRLGGTVSISSNGRRFSTGATQYDAPGLSQNGLARVFQYNETTQLWDQLGQDLIGSANDFYGIETEISKDGTRLAVGAQGTAATSGYAIIYDYNPASGLWEQVGNTIEGDNLGDQFGFYIEFTPDANKVVVSSYKSESFRGMVKVFELVNNIWQQIGNTIKGKVAGEQFGLSVSISDDGNSLIVGAPYNKETGRENGAARVYKLINNNWTQQGTDFMSVNQTNNSHAGSSVFMTGNGEKVAIGYEQEINTATAPLATGTVRVYNIGTLLAANGINLAKEKLSIYPNPVSDIFKIQNSKTLGIESIEIYSMDGKLVKTFQAIANTFSVSELTTGQYFVLAKTKNNQRFGQTLIKK